MEIFLLTMFLGILFIQIAFSGCESDKKLEFIPYPLLNNLLDIINPPNLLTMSLEFLSNADYNLICNYLKKSGRAANICRVSENVRYYGPRVTEFISFTNYVDATNVPYFFHPRIKQTAFFTMYNWNVNAILEYSGNFYLDSIKPKTFKTKYTDAHDPPNINLSEEWNKNIQSFFIDKCWSVSKPLIPNCESCSLSLITHDGELIRLFLKGYPIFKEVDILSYVSTGQHFIHNLSPSMFMRYLPVDRQNHLNLPSGVVPNTLLFHLFDGEKKTNATGICESWNRDSSPVPVPTEVHVVFNGQSDLQRNEIVSFKIVFNNELASQIMKIETFFDTYVRTCSQN
jgi:hypothetical protein